MDQRRCIGCHSCTVACKSENNVPPGYWRSWVKGMQKGVFPNAGVFYLRRLCNHCDVPPCVQVCPVQATVRRESDGVVGNGTTASASAAECAFQRALTMRGFSTRFATPLINATSVRLASTTACNRPAWSHALSRALVFGDLDDPQSEISRRLVAVGTSVIKPELGTKPKVFYVAGEHDLMGRIKFSTDFERQIELYGRSIPSPEAPHWNEGGKK